MKTKKSIIGPGSLKALIILPVIFLILILFASCAARKKTAKTTPAVTQVATQPSLSVGQKMGDAYTVVDEMPVYPGGDEALLMFISNNTRYPKEAKDNNIQGRVIVRFKINIDGTVSDASILKGVDANIDKESLRVISLIPKFTPGKLNGVTVPVWYMVPITFTLAGAGPQRQIPYEITGTDTIYSYTDQMPKFPGGTEALLKFKTDNVKYPAELKALGIEGVVLVRFMIEKNGSVSDARIMVGSSPALDAEALRVTRLMPAWLPGREKGKPVKVTNMTSYEFLLTPRKPAVQEEGTPFVVVEEMPMFPGGDSALLAYITKNTKYPEAAKNRGVEGRVILRFCVTDTGGIDRVSVLKGVDPELDAEAIRVVKSLPKFSPGKQGGKPVNVWYMVPISFGVSKPAAQTAQNRPPQSSQQQMPAGYDEVPVFSGGEKAMYKFIKSKIVYPKTAKENKISGKVILRITIDTDGTINEVQVVKGINPDLDAEAMRVVRLLPAWKPGKLAGTPVKVRYTIPVTFSLKK